VVFAMALDSRVDTYYNDGMTSAAAKHTIRRSDFNDSAVVDHEGSEYTAHFNAEGEVVYSVDDEWAGVGTWTGSETIDCGATIPEIVLHALDAGLRELAAE